MTLYDVKPYFQAILRPLVKILYQCGITANQVTLAALIGSLVVGGILILSPSLKCFLILPIFLFIRMALNAMDGMLAREFKQQSNLGALLNEIGDVVSDVALYLPFALLTDVSSILVLLVIFLAILTEFCGVLAQTIGSTRRYDGPMGKSDRALTFGSYALLLALLPNSYLYINWVFIGVAILLLWTCINRCYRALLVSKKD